MIELKLPVFEGPLDLLLHLIEREDLDITTVSLVQVTDQYLAHLRKGDANAAALADFVATGARLLYLKSKALLPSSPEREIETEDEGEDLTSLLMEYRQLREVATYFREIEEKGRRSYSRRAAPPEQIALPMGLGDVTLEALARIFQETLARQEKRKPPAKVIQRNPISVEDKIRVLRRLLDEKGRISFSELMLECHSREEVVVQFLAVLELIKLNKVRARQDSAFSDIQLVPAKAQRQRTRRAAAHK